MVEYRLLLENNDSQLLFMEFEKSGCRNLENRDRIHDRCRR